MKKCLCRIWNLLLIVALGALAISFYCNYKRLKLKIARLKKPETVLHEHDEAEKIIFNLPNSVSNKVILVSYAQVMEDVILYNVLGDVPRGFYIDVGANDPIFDSVTKLFYEEGWHGINIEPLEHEYNALVLDRPRDINLCVGVGSVPGELFLYENGGLSTVDISIAKTWKKKPTPRKIQVLPLSQICKQYCPKDVQIQFCKIDVEGFEKEVLLGCDFENFRPKILVIEATEPCTMIPTQQKWEDILLQNNYEFVYQYGVNRYYVDKNFPELKQKFIEIEKLLEKYLVIKF